MTAFDAPDEHALQVVRSSAERPILTSLPRGRERGHQLVCGACGSVLAWDRRPMDPPAPVLRCTPCQSLNDATGPRPG